MVVEDGPQWWCKANSLVTSLSVSMICVVRVMWGTEHGGWEWTIAKQSSLDPMRWTSLTQNDTGSVCHRIHTDHSVLDKSDQSLLGHHLMFGMIIWIVPTPRVWLPWFFVGEQVLTVTSGKIPNSHGGRMKPFLFWLMCLHRWNRQMNGGGATNRKPSSQYGCLSVPTHLGFGRPFGSFIMRCLEKCCKCQDQNKRPGDCHAAWRRVLDEKLDEIHRSMRDTLFKN